MCIPRYIRKIEFQCANVLLNFDQVSLYQIESETSPICQYVNPKVWREFHSIRFHFDSWLKQIAFVITQRLRVRERGEIKGLNRSCSQSSFWRSNPWSSNRFASFFVFGVEIERIFLLIHRSCKSCNCSNSSVVFFLHLFPFLLRCWFFFSQFRMQLYWCGAFAYHIMHAFVRHRYMACVWLCFCFVRFLSLSLSPFSV